MEPLPVREVTLDVWLNDSSHIRSDAWQGVFEGLRLTYLSSDGIRLPISKTIVHRGTLDFDEAELLYYRKSAMSWKELNVIDGTNLPL